MSFRDRRNFIKRTAVTAIGAIALPKLVKSEIVNNALATEKPGKKVSIEKGDVVLLQGDSITDWGRDQKKPDANDFNALGTGYAYLVSAGLLSKYSEKNLSLYNRGISGNKVYQLAERWDADCLNLKPNVLSILIGVNDYWHTLNHAYNGTVEKYKTDYIALLERTKKALPDVKLIIGEPFALKDVKAVTDAWYPAFDEYRAAAKEVAIQFDAMFIPYQSIFNKGLEGAPAKYWTMDGVHPTIAGAGLMAHAWLEMVK